MEKTITIRQNKTACSALGHRGMALVLCLLLMTILCLIGGAALGISSLNQKIVHNVTKQIQAFYLAEAGKETALAYLREAPLWRGGEAPASGSYDGELVIGGGRGLFDVTLSDCTADENGVLDVLLPPGHVRIRSTGAWFDAEASVSCLAHITPSGEDAASFPRAAVVSSGAVTGPLVAMNDLGGVDASLVMAATSLPAANASGLRAMAAASFPEMDDDVWDAALSGITSFWLDPPANTQPRILHVRGDVDLSGSRRLYGIVLVEGTEVSVDEESEVIGILYAPNTTDLRVRNTGVSGRVVVSGQLVSGPGGVVVSGNPVAFQYDPDYVDAFNDAAGWDLDVDMVPGSWGTH